MIPSSPRPHAHFSIASWIVGILIGTALGCGPPYADPVRPAAASDAGPEVLGRRLTERFGCEETFVARDSESTVVLAVDVPGILERSRRADLPYSEEIRVGTPGIVVRLEQGADLDHWCTDVMARPPRIDAAWVGVSGLATIVVLDRRAQELSAATGGRPPPTRAVVRLSAAVLAREDRRQERVTLSGLEIAAILGVPGGG